MGPVHSDWSLADEGRTGKVEPETRAVEGVGEQRNRTNATDIFSSPFKGGEAGIRDACVPPPQPAGCVKSAVGRAAVGRGMGLMRTTVRRSMAKYSPIPTPALPLKANVCTHLNGTVSPAKAGVQKG